MGDVTDILHRMQAGDAAAGDELLEVIYDELRWQARKRMAFEKQGNTLQGTALVHEVYLRLFERPKSTQWESRAHFFGAVAEVMRRILVDRARAKLTQKRRSTNEGLDDDFSVIQTPAASARILAVHDTLDKLAATAPDVAELVKLRFFVGYTIVEVAEIMAISPRQANRLWAYGKAWLSTELRDDIS